MIEPRVTTVNEHGAHADYIRVAASQIIPLADELTFEAGAAIGCGTGTAWGGLKRPGDVAGLERIRELISWSSRTSCHRHLTSVVAQALASLAPWGEVYYIGIDAEVTFKTAEAFTRQLTILTS